MKSELALMMSPMKSERPFCRFFSLKSEPKNVSTSWTTILPLDWSIVVLQTATQMWVM